MSLPPISHRQHEAVRKRLAASGDVLIMKAAANLATLQDRRKKADYDMGESEVERDDRAREAIRIAKGIVRGIDGCPTGDVRLTTIQASIQIAISAGSI